MNLQAKLGELARVRKENNEVMAKTASAARREYVLIQENDAFGCVCTAVIFVDHIGRRSCKDICQGATTDHSKNAARFHAGKLNQGIIAIHHVDGGVSHIRTKDE